jgi:hypothetical protein
MPESREPISSFGDGYKLAEELINASCLYKPWRLEKREIATIHCKVAPILSGNLLQGLVLAAVVACIRE